MQHSMQSQLLFCARQQTLPRRCSEKRASTDADSAQTRPCCLPWLLQGPRTLLEDRRTTGRVVLHAFASLSAQWFDSMALVVLGPQLAGAMLPAGMPPLQQLQRLFGIFALGHVLRLLGCFLWPAQAAKLGHKGLLAWTLGLSGFCTALSACMPSYSEVRLAAVDTRCSASEQCCAVVRLCSAEQPAARAACTQGERDAAAALRGMCGCLASQLFEQC